MVQFLINFNKITSVVPKVLRLIVYVTLVKTIQNFIPNSYLLYIVLHKSHIVHQLI